jgi:hypothetical protein
MGVLVPRSSFTPRLALALAFVACGSRTGLLLAPPNDASPDEGALDAQVPEDATVDSEAFDVTTFDASGDAGSDASSDGPSPDGTSADASDASGADAPSIEAAGPDADAAEASDAGVCGTHCSSDLLSILDCHGNVVMACTNGQGCNGNATACVDGCVAATESQSSYGCDYYVVDPDIISAAQGACLAAFIANAWDTPVSISIERAGTVYDGATYGYLPTGSGQSITYAPLPGGQVPPGQVAIVFLASATAPPVGACPAGVHVMYTAADQAVYGTGLGVGYHITTTAPVTAFDILPYGGGQAAATSATLLFPTTAWDTTYVAVNAYPQSQIAMAAGAQPSLDVVASVDATTVTITPSAAIVGGTGVSGAEAGAPTVYTLDKGQVLQISQPAELTGSSIQADKPIGVWGGASCLNIPVDIAACDSAHQQIPPVRTLGWEYAAVSYRERFDAQAESPPWRMVGAVNGTTLTYDPSAPAGAPSTLNAGQLATFDSPGGFTVTSQDGAHPFYLSAHMTGCQETDPSETDCRGDPEFVNVIPPAQYLGKYVFFTDPTYPETDLVLVRQNVGGQGFQDVTLDCAGVLTGWTPIGAAGTYEYTRIDLVRGNFVPQNGCNNGVHEIQSAAPFGLTVWGWGSAATGGSYGCTGCGGFYTQAVSYAYPGGASVKPINGL